MASFYLRAVCQNRNPWGVEVFEEITIRHSKYAASRFAHEAAPAPWSNGQTEGQITKLKLIKRLTYGRAKIDLLEARLIGTNAP